MTIDSELAKHIGHRATLVDARHLRCVDCTQTVLLPTPTVSSASASRVPPRQGQTGTCTEHPTEWDGSCRWCRADQLQTSQDQLAEIRQRRENARTDPTQIPEWREARQRLAARTEAGRRRLAQERLTAPTSEQEQP